ncbi:hypothetical protein R50073_16480 [Maricurvus nonylphenolicus]|uniref:AHH domain-containing protein n=1 Tax=Maricurvus nonylphenolicus TaxID=1008307 RepID=UPI0036F3232C
MPVPEKPVKYHEKNLLDHVIDQTTSQKEELTAADCNRIATAAQVQAGIDNYRAQAAQMSTQQLRDEQHVSSRLGAHLEEAGHLRPAKCHAHALVAGKHQYAAILRALMARLGIRIDDSDNGCWLPENTAATPHPAFPKAVPHSRIHRYNYFFWLRFRLGSIRQEQPFRTTLQLTARHLQQGTQPEFVMMKKGQGLPVERIA